MNAKTVAIIIVVFLAAVIIFIAGGKPAEKGSAGNETNTTNVSKQLYFDSLAAGKGVQSYYYAYREDRNGYLVKVTLEKNLNSTKITEQIPLSTRTLYTVDNKSVLCLKISQKDESCTYAENTTYVNNYIGRLQSLLFNDEGIAKAGEDYRLLAEKGLLTFENTEDSGTKLGKCTRFGFKIDYSELGIQDAARFGLGANSPLAYIGYFCVNSVDKNSYEKYFKYDFKGKSVYTNFTLLGYDFGKAPEISLPENVTNRLASTLIEEEKSDLAEFLSCYKKVEKKDVESCVYTYAVIKKNELACPYLSDRNKSQICLLNVAVENKDDALCSRIDVQDYKDDCYVEIAGLTKNSGLCGRISNDDKTQLCKQAAASNSTTVKPYTKTVDYDSIEIATYNETAEQQKRDAIVNNISVND